MSTPSTSLDPLSYQGIDQYTQPYFYNAERAPSSQDLYPPGTRWQDSSVSPRVIYETTGAGDWQATSSSTGIETINSNPAVADNYDLVGTANQITITETAGTSTFTIPAAFIAPGSIEATTTLTATLGDITATDGNIVRGTAGNKDVYSSVASTITAGANSAGTVVLVGGTATISTTAVTASSIIRIYRQGIGATGAAALGILTIDNIVANTSFDINSVQAADATTLQASDVSVIAWEIVN